MFGGSDANPSGKSVGKEMAKDENYFYVGGDFKMKLDLSQKTLSMVVDGEKLTIDPNIDPNFQYSPIVVLYRRRGTPEFEVTLL